MNILIEKFKQRNEISTIFLYILYFLLGMYYPLFSFMRQTVPQYWNQVTLFVIWKLPCCLPMSSWQ